MKRTVKITVLMCTVIMASAMSNYKNVFESSISHKLEIHCKQEVQQKLPNRDFQMFSELKSVISFKKAKSEVPNHILFEARYEKLKITLESSLYFMELNSQRSTDNEDILDPVVKSVINLPFYIELNDKREVVQIYGLDSLYKRAVSEVDFFNAEAKKELLNSLIASFGEEALQCKLDMLTSFFPDINSPENNSWRKKVDINTFIAGSVENNYQIENCDQTICTISMHSNQFNADNTNIGLPGNIPANYEVSGSQEGVMELKNGNGWISKGIVSVNIEGKIKIEKCEQFPNGDEWPISCNSEINYKSVN